MAYLPHHDNCFLVADCNRSGGDLPAEEVLPGAGGFDDGLQQIGQTQFSGMSAGGFWKRRLLILVVWCFIVLLLDCSIIVMCFYYSLTEVISRLFIKIRKPQT